MGTGIGKWIEVPSIWLVVCLCFLFLCGSARGEETGAILPKHAFALGLCVSHFNYQEDHPLGGLEVDGLMYGVTGGYTYHNKLVIDASLDYSRGDLDYEGWWQSGTPLKADEEDWIVEGRVLIGYDHIFRGKHMLTPFFGVGYRYRNIELKGPGGFEREEEYRYSPVGVRTHSPLSDNWTWGMSLEYDLFWDGEVDYHGVYYPSFDLDSGYGLKFSVRFSRQFADNYILSVQPHLAYWHIKESDDIVLSVPSVYPGFYVIVQAFEPENDTTFYGLRISLEF